MNVATGLRREHGTEALARATEKRTSALDLGHIARADLYQAVCTILADRQQVFTRWSGRRPFS